MDDEINNTTIAATRGLSKLSSPQDGTICKRSKAQRLQISQTTMPNWEVHRTIIFRETDTIVITRHYMKIPQNLLRVSLLMINNQQAEAERHSPKYGIMS